MWKRDQAIAIPGARPEQSGETPRAPSPSPETTMSASTERVVVDLGKSVVIKGELSGSEDLTIHGRMEGSISLKDHTLTIGPQADVKADISAKAVIVIGAVTGKVIAIDKIGIRATGAVTGDIVSPRLVIADGGCLRGAVEMAR